MQMPPHAFVQPNMQGFGFQGASNAPGYQQMYPGYQSMPSGYQSMPFGAYSGPPYGFPPAQYPASGTPTYPTNGNSFPGKQYGATEYGRNGGGPGSGSGGGGSGAPNTSGRGRNNSTGGRGGSGGKLSKGSRGGGGTSAGSTPPAFAGAQPGMGSDVYSQGAPMYAPNYDQWGQGQQRYDVSYSKDTKQSGYTYGPAPMSGFDPSQGAYQHQHPQYPTGPYQQQVWGAEKQFGNKGPF
jgi:hypothetical protein